MHRVWGLYELENLLMTCVICVEWRVCRACLDNADPNSTQSTLRSHTVCLNAFQCKPTASLFIT